MASKAKTAKKPIKSKGKATAKTVKKPTKKPVSKPKTKKPAKNSVKNTASNAPKSATVDEKEVKKFTSTANEWWNERGKFKPLHKINPIRIGYIKDKIFDVFGPSPDDSNPLQGIRVLDIGCGGGLLSEPLAKLGAEVTGIDAGEENIKVADEHAKNSKLKIEYICTSAEEFLKKKEQFDVVLNMEVIEHVADVDEFLKASCKLVKPGGMMITATLNRTIKSYALAIVGAEYVLGWLPKGTHKWSKFLKPSEIEKTLRKNKMEVREIQGIKYDPAKDLWRLAKDIKVNYMMMSVKD